MGYKSRRWVGRVEWMAANLNGLGGATHGTARTSTAATGARERCQTLMCKERLGMQKKSEDWVPIAGETGPACWPGSRVGSVASLGPWWLRGADPKGGMRGG